MCSPLLSQVQSLAVNCKEQRQVITSRDMVRIIWHCYINEICCENGVKWQDRQTIVQNILQQFRIWWSSSSYILVACIKVVHVTGMKTNTIYIRLTQVHNLFFHCTQSVECKQPAIDTPVGFLNHISFSV